MKAVQLGVVEKPIVNDSVDRVTLREDRLVLAGDPHGVWMVREHGPGVRYYTDLYFKTVGSMPSRMIEVANNAAIGAALAAGFAAPWCRRPPCRPACRHGSWETSSCGGSMRWCRVPV